MKSFLKGACIAAVALVPSIVAASCEDGEVVVKFAHVTNTDKHPKGIAATLLESRVNKEMNGKMCMEVFPNSTLYDDNKVLEAMLQGDVDEGRIHLKSYVSATIGFTELGRRMDRDPKNLTRMLSPRGNPTAANLFEIIQACVKTEGISIAAHVIPQGTSPAVRP